MTNHKISLHSRKSLHAARATIHDVAAEAAVSAATVSRVLNGTANVMPETVARVRAAVTKLNFVPNSVARNLSLRRTNTLGRGDVGVDELLVWIDDRELSLRQAAEDVRRAGRLLAQERTQNHAFRLRGGPESR